MLGYFIAWKIPMICGPPCKLC